MHPTRKWLQHSIPVSVPDRDPVFFITVCCRIRGRNHLANPGVWEHLLESVRIRNEDGRWNCRLFLAMPDHAHGIVSLPRPEDLVRAMASWKRWIASCAGIAWQKGFFDHRLRSTLAVREKSAYILQNPVRGGLVENSDDWPFRYIDDSWLKVLSLD